MAYFWSSASNSFYADALRNAYEAAGTWPQDALPVTDRAFAIYSQNPPVGKVRGSVNGQPAWIEDAPSGQTGAQAALVALLTDKESAGVYFQPAGAPSPILFATDANALIKLTGIAIALQQGVWTGGSLPAADNQPVLLSGVDTGVLVQKVFSYISLCNAHYALLHQRLTVDPMADITQGWPSQA